MQKDIIPATIPASTIGLDLSDKTVTFCQLDAVGDIVERGNFQLTRAALQKRFANLPAARVALECCTQSAWVQDVLVELGHEVIIANAREVRSIAGSSRKSDTRDAEQLARLARVDPKLLHPITHRGKQRRMDMVVIRTRALMVDSRTRLVVGARNLAKMFGERIPSCTTKNFAERAASSLPPALSAALSVIVKQIEAISEAIEQCDRQIEELCTKLPETRWLRQVNGVGALTAAAFVLTIDDPDRFAKSRDVGPFLGLVPKRDQSGEGDPQLGISKCGDRYLRKLLVQCAQHMLRKHGVPSALRDWGLKQASRGRRAKKIAVVAIARKLAVLLHRLWKHQATYYPYPPPDLLAKCA